MTQQLNFTDEAGAGQRYRDAREHCAQTRLGEAHPPHQFQYRLPAGTPGIRIDGSYDCDGLAADRDPWPIRPAAEMRTAIPADATCCELAVADAAERVAALTHGGPFFSNADIKIGWREAITAATTATVQPLVEQIVRQLALDEQPAGVTVEEVLDG